MIRKKGDNSYDEEREKKIDILHGEIKRQYNEIKESQNRITNTGLTILIGFILFMVNDLLDMEMPSYDYIIVFSHIVTILCLFISVYYIFRCITLKLKPIGVDINALISGFDEGKTRLDLKNTITKNLKDSFYKQKDSSLKKAYFYKKALLFLVISFVLFTILKLRVLFC